MKFFIKFLKYILILNILTAQAMSAKSNLIYSSEHVLQLEEFKIDDLGSLYNSENGLKLCFL